MPINLYPLAAQVVIAIVAKAEGAIGEMKMAKHVLVLAVDVDPAVHLERRLKRRLAHIPVELPHVRKEDMILAASRTVFEDDSILRFV